MPAWVQTSEHQHLLPPSPGDPHTAAIRWWGVPPATIQEIFFLSASRPGETAGSQVLGTERHCFGSPVLSKSCPKPLVHQLHTHTPLSPKCQQAAGGVCWGWGMPGNQDNPTSTTQERACTICARSSQGHGFWWVTSPSFPGYSGPRTSDPTVGLHPHLLQPLSLFGLAFAPCALQEPETGRPPCCTRLCL